MSMTPEEKALLLSLKDRLDRMERQDRFRFYKDIEFPVLVGTRVGTNPQNRFGFWGVEPVQQPESDIGNVGHYAIGGATVGYQDQWTGADALSSRWTINGIIDALKNVGILKR